MYLTILRNNDFLVFVLVDSLLILYECLFGGCLFIYFYTLPPNLKSWVHRWPMILTYYGAMITWLSHLTPNLHVRRSLIIIIFQLCLLHSWKTLCYLFISDIMVYCYATVIQLRPLSWCFIWYHFVLQWA